MNDEMNDENRQIKIEVFGVQLIPLHDLRKQLAAQGLQLIEGPAAEVEVLKQRVIELESRHKVAETAYRAALDFVQTELCSHPIVAGGQCMRCGAEI